MDSSNKDHAPTPPPLQPALDPHSTTINPPTSLGILSKLPLEIRNEIYRQVHEHKYWSYNCDNPQSGDRKWLSINRQGLPTVTLSKAIREEFLAALLTGAVFVFFDAGVVRPNIWTRNKILFIDRIQNVRYMRCLDIDSDISHVGTLDGWIGNVHQQRRDDLVMLKQIAEPISSFTGTEVMRGNCSIKLICITPKVAPLLHSSFFDAIRSLTGFRNVKLTLSLVNEADWRNGALRSGVGPPSTDCAIEFRALADTMSTALEPSLGPSVIREDNKKRPVCPKRDDGLYFPRWKITFHPRDYVFKEKNVKLSSSAKRDEENESLPRN